MAESGKDTNNIIKHSMAESGKDTNNVIKHSIAEYLIHNHRFINYHFSKGSVSIDF